MGRGRSGLGKKGGGGANAAPAKANTPSGIDYNQFMAMSESQRWQTMSNIIADSSIKVPPILDGSVTTKVIYALGMNNKPTIVSDDQLDRMPGKDLYRTVYESGSMPPPSSAGILDQIRSGDYTQMSGAGGSAHGRALYFARDDFVGSRVYGDGERNALMMRAKINPGAKIVNEQTLKRQMVAKGFNVSGSSSRDDIALYALSQGIDGWYSNTYTMMVNRGVLTASSRNKRITEVGKGVGQTKTGRLKRGVSYANSWDGAENAN